MAVGVMTVGIMVVEKCRMEEAGIEGEVFAAWLLVRVVHTRVSQSHC